MEQSPVDSEVTVPETSPTFLPTVGFPLYSSPPTLAPCQQPKLLVPCEDYHYKNSSEQNKKMTDWRGIQGGMLEGEAQQIKGDMEGLNPWTSFCDLSIT
jgi:hypothetical protein